MGAGAFAEWSRHAVGGASGWHELSPDGSVGDGSWPLGRRGRRVVRPRRRRKTWRRVVTTCRWRGVEVARTVVWRVGGRRFLTPRRTRGACRAAAGTRAVPGPRVVTTCRWWVVGVARTVVCGSGGRRFVTPRRTRAACSATAVEAGGVLCDRGGGGRPGAEWSRHAVGVASRSHELSSGGSAGVGSWPLGGRGRRVVRPRPPRPRPRPPGGQSCKWSVRRRLRTAR